jgi:hypothetical protein
MPLDEAIKMLISEARPPDQRTAKAQTTIQK